MQPSRRAGKLFSILSEMNYIIIEVALRLNSGWGKKIETPDCFENYLGKELFKNWTESFLRAAMYGMSTGCPFVRVGIEKLQKRQFC